MSKPVRLLMCVSSESDAELILRHLRRGGFKLRWRRVQSADAALAALAEERWDVIISDRLMPLFSSQDALETLHGSDMDIPFILVSEAVDEEFTAAAMKQGVHDCVTKESLDGLVPAIERQIRNASSRRERRESAAVVSRAIRDWEATFDAVPDGIAIISMDYRILRVNRALASRLGVHPGELVGKQCYRCFHGAAEPPPNCPHRQLVEDGAEHAADIFEGRLGGWFAVTDSPLRREDGSVGGSVHVMRDITARKQAEDQHQLLSDLAQELLTVESVHDAMSACVHKARRIHGIDVGGASLCDGCGGSMRVVCNEGLTARFAEAVLCTGADSPDARLLTEGKPVYVKCGVSGTELDSLAVGEGLLSLAILPVHSAGKAVGCLAFASHTEDTISPVCRSLLETIAAQLGIVIGRLVAEHRLRESEVNYRRLVEDATDIVYSTDTMGCFTYIGPKVARYGFNPGQLIGQHFLSIVDPNDQERIGLDLMRAMDTGKTAPTVFRLMAAPDCGVWVEDCSALSHNEKGEPAGLSGVLRDVTARALVEHALERRVIESTAELAKVSDALRQTKQRYAIIAKNLPNGVVHVLDRNLRCVFRDGLGIDACGPTNEDVIGKSVFEVFPPSAAKEVAINLAGCLRGESVVFECAYLAETFLVHASPLTDAEGLVCEVLLLAINISERKRWEEELLKARDLAEAASQAKSDFLASMSHELRTPLNSVIGFSEALEDRYFGRLTSKQTEYVRHIAEGGRHLLALINDILDLSKVEAGRMSLDPGPVRVGELLDGSLAMVRDKCLHRGIAIDLDLPCSLRKAIITADGRKLRQVVINLLSNSTKFTPEGGRITVAARLVPDAFDQCPDTSTDAVDPSSVNGVPSWLRVTVTDTGEGIPIEFQKRIFEPFYQVKSGTTDRTPGTGLGLCLTKRLVELHGGRIVVESEGRNKGCRATFFVPTGVVSWDERQPKQDEATKRG